MFKDMVKANIISSIKRQSMYYNFMNKSYIYLLFLAVAASAQTASEGTEGFYISPHGISRQREVHDALEKVASKMSVERTTYNTKGITYTADHFILKIAYVDGKQSIDITGNDEVKVSGGRIEFEYQFSFSKYDAGKTINGSASGSVVSESLNYTKMLTFGQDGHLIWCLVPGNKSFTPLTIVNRMKVKRMEPFNATDFEALEDILDRAISQIVPGTVESQLLEKFNSVMPLYLNTTLNSYILGPEIMYTFNHATKGALNMTIIHHLYQFGITPEDGYKVIYLTEIKDWPEPVCDGVNVPDKHLSWTFYGGAQNIHLTCLYQQVVQYVQKKGWLDTKLDTTWDCNAFQFYAGDLFDLINNLYLNVGPRELVDGECKASADRLSIKHSRDLHNNLYALDVTYTCTAKTRDKTYKYIDVLNFSADVRFFIEARADKIELDFTIVDAEAVNLNFKPVGSYFVGNINLALFKANQVLHKLKGTKVFGTGFPSLAREAPGTEVTQDYVVYYDLSLKGTQTTQQLLEL